MEEFLKMMFPPPPPPPKPKVERTYGVWYKDGEIPH
jgi:hypothetical protein